MFEMPTPSPEESDFVFLTNDQLDPALGITADLRITHARTLNPSVYEWLDTGFRLSAPDDGLLGLMTVCPHIDNLDIKLGYGLEDGDEFCNIAFIHLLLEQGRLLIWLRLANDSHSVPLQLTYGLKIGVVRFCPETSKNIQQVTPYSGKVMMEDSPSPLMDRFRDRLIGTIRCLPSTREGRVHPFIVRVLYMRQLMRGGGPRMRFIEERENEGHENVS